MKRICVFCGSTKGHHTAYEHMTRHLGQLLVQRGIGLVYGGGNIGLMGVIAETVLEQGGEVTGIIPTALAEKELAFQNITDLRIVHTMHERKALMEQLSDGFIALPGGYGTLEEICEMVTWAQLHIHHKPCGLLNVEGFYDSLLAFMDHQVHQGFLTSSNRTLIINADDPRLLLDQMQQQVNAPHSPQEHSQSSTNTSPLFTN
ncbi:MAG: cytokinin riboside 5'-monophosphate phosphoribohydrolase [Nitrospirales bacterium]|nr:MAG: cytokinin riboside 5'-monophosphate phosphoribohydrolase [Nitrospirales bacterium]